MPARAPPGATGAPGHPGGHRRPAAALPAGPDRAGRGRRLDGLLRGAGGRGRRQLRQAAQGPLLPGSYGTRGVGYDVEYLVYQISRELGLTQDWPVVIVGIGNLGHALANYGGFASRGFRVARAARRRPGASVGTEVAGLAGAARSTSSRTIVARPRRRRSASSPPRAGAAQEVCDRLVAAGVTSILNFAPTVLSVPDGVDVRKVDLSIELQILAFHEQRKAGERAGETVDAAVAERSRPTAAVPA